MEMAVTSPTPPTAVNLASFPFRSSFLRTVSMQRSSAFLMSLSRWEIRSLSIFLISASVSVPSLQTMAVRESIIVWRNFAFRLSSAESTSRSSRIRTPILSANLEMSAASMESFFARFPSALANCRTRNASAYAELVHEGYEPEFVASRRLHADDGLRLPRHVTQFPEPPDVVVDLDRRRPGAFLRRRDVDVELGLRDVHADVNVTRNV